MKSLLMFRCNLEKLLVDLEATQSIQHCKGQQRRVQTEKNVHKMDKHFSPKVAINNSKDFAWQLQVIMLGDCYQGCAAAVN